MFVAHNNDKNDNRAAKSIKLAILIVSDLFSTKCREISRTWSLFYPEAFIAVLD
jgi:hypothetical protein